jgi:hypothetical protein
MNINQAIETAKAKAANHPEWLRAIEKAAKLMASGELCVTLFADNTALVTSPNGSYRVNGVCPCAAKTAHCYHRAAKRLAEMTDAPEASFVADVAESSRANLIAEIENIWPRVETTPLADALMSRFGVNYLEALSIDFLQAIRIAIA